MIVLSTKTMQFNFYVFCWTNVEQTPKETNKVFKMSKVKAQIVLLGVFESHNYSLKWFVIRISPHEHRTTCNHLMSTSYVAYVYSMALVYTWNSSLKKLFC